MRSPSENLLSSSDIAVPGSQQLYIVPVKPSSAAAAAAARFTPNVSEELVDIDSIDVLTSDS